MTPHAQPTHHTHAEAIDAATQAQQQEIARLRAALTSRVLRSPLEVAASYDVDGETVGARLHGRESQKALMFLDDVLEGRA